MRTQQTDARARVSKSTVRARDGGFERNEVAGFEIVGHETRKQIFGGNADNFSVVTTLAGHGTRTLRLSQKIQNVDAVTLFRLSLKVFVGESHLRFEKSRALFRQHDFDWRRDRLTTSHFQRARELTRGRSVDAKVA